MLLLFGTLSAVLAYLDLYLAAFIAQNLTARLRVQLFEHLQRLSLDWHGKQKKGDLVQRVTGNIADIEKLVTDGLVDLLAGVLTLVGVVSIMLFIGIVNLIFSLDEFSPLQPISRGQSGMYEREKREEAPLSRLFSVIISTILIKLTIP